MQRTAEAYARRIERRWSALSERAVVLSPRDWAQILSWHERGIPLDIVIQAIDHAFDRARKHRSPPRLSRLAALVEEAWTTVVDGRVGGEAVAQAPEPPNAPAIAWERCRVTLGPDSALAELLKTLVLSLAAGAEPASIDERLDGALCETAPADIVAAAAEQVDRDLAPYRRRIAAAEFQATRRRALVEQLRKRLALPRL